MSPAAERFFRNARRKASSMQPDVSRAYLKGLDALRRQLTTREIEALIAAGRGEQIIFSVFSPANLDTTFARFRAQVQVTTKDAASYTVRGIPHVPPGVSFDVLNPRVLDGLRALDTRVMTRLGTETRATVRAIIEQGLRDGAGPRTTARHLRELIGIGETQLQQVANFRAALESGQVGKALGYAARDRRFDASIKSGTLTPEKIDVMVEKYLARRIAINAENTARTATLDAFKTGQRLSWTDAIEKGFIDGGNLMKEWIGVNDDRERPEHLEMNGEIVPFDEPYSNGQTTAGEGDFNCRCLDRVFMARAA